MDETSVSVRGLVDSDFENPLREFTGTFDGYEKSPATGYQGWRIDLKFKDLDNVIVAKGFVYNFPTAVLNFPESNKHKSRWGYLGDSLAALLPPDEDIKDCKEKRMRLMFCDGQDGRPEPKPIWNREADPAEFPDKMVPTPVWIVSEVEGMSVESGGAEQTTPDWAAENIIGKTRAQFNKWAFADPRVRKDTALQRSISDKSFIKGLLQLKIIAEDEDGVFQKATTP